VDGLDFPLFVGTSIAEEPGTLLIVIAAKLEVIPGSSSSEDTRNLDEHCGVRLRADSRDSKSDRYSW
jgi:MinD-like ATPase involved in chromosome partitioning or flagellar assembly